MTVYTGTAVMLARATAISRRLASQLSALCTARFDRPVFSAMSRSATCTLATPAPCVSRHRKRYTRNAEG